MRWFKNLIGNLRGFGCCMHCKDRWNWKKSKPIRYDDNRSMFPVCEECFDKLGIDMILSYCSMLYYSWHKDKWHSFVFEAQRKKAIKTLNWIEKEVERMKK